MGTEEKASQVQAELGVRLRRARRRAGLRQLDLARLTGISPTQLSEYENGRVIPSVANLVRLCDILGLSFLTPQRTVYSSRWVEVPALSPHEAAEASPNLQPRRGVDIERFPFPVELIPDADHTRCVTVQGRGMYPEIAEGWQAAVALAGEPLEKLSGELCAVNVPGEGILIRRVRVRPLRIDLEAVNPEYEVRRTFDRRQVGRAFVLGRVLAVRKESGECWAP